MKKLSTVMAAALVAVLFVAALVVGGRARLGHDPKSSADFGHVPMSRAQGLMPEVVVTAERPTLVMPTVEVRAYRSVAMSGSGSNVN